MQKNNIAYTIFSVIALIIVIVGIVFAWRSWDNERNMNENNTLSN